jgi:hypothetical protein
VVSDEIPEIFHPSSRFVYPSSASSLNSADKDLAATGAQCHELRINDKNRTWRIGR